MEVSVNEQLELFNAFRRGHEAAEAAADRADRDSDGWTEQAEVLFARFAKEAAKPFLTEEARRFAESCGLPKPPDGRAWGHVAKKCQRTGVIVPAGFRAAKSSNGSPKILWAANN
jgi:hypothetical protein